MSNEPIEAEIADDPVLGKVIGNYPSDRIRLLVIGGIVYGAFAMVINLALLPLPPETASIIVIILLAIFALAVGWGILHFWNREVILFERGFSYREGSREVYINYTDVHATHLHAERIRYVGGLITRNVRRFTVKTRQDEVIVLNGSIYRKIDTLIDRMEKLINEPLRVHIGQALANGQSVPFGDSLSITADAITLTGEGRSLAWNEYAGYGVSGGALNIRAADATNWASIPLDAIENVALLVEILNRKRPAS